MVFFALFFCSWLYLYFFLLPALFKSCLATAALFETSILNCISLRCGGIGLSFPTYHSLVLSLLLWLSGSPWNLSSLLSVSLVLLANFLLAAYFCFLCFSFFKWDHFGSYKIVLHGRSMLLCSTLMFFPSWLFSGCTSYTKLSFPLQSTIL